MAEEHDYLALDWVKDEIRDTLDQAQQALEAWVENPEDSTRMRFCQTYLHQVFGTLQMVEFYGASLLAEEMEKLSQALLDEQVPEARMADARETLMRAILQLPSYLERVQSSRRDLPVVLLPLLNDMRAARGEALLSETSLFKPDLESSAPSGQVPPPPAKDDPNFPQLSRKIRQMYQLALLGVLREQDRERNLGFMSKVFAKLEQVSGEASMARLWRASGALVEGIASGVVETGTSVKMLLGQIDRVLKQIVVGGAGILTETPPRDLLKNELYYIARSGGDTPRIRQVCEEFQLDHALPGEDLVNEERARLTGPDREAMTSVSTALSEELDKVKLALEQLVQEDRADPEALDEQCTVLKQVADTVAMLGMGQPRKAVEEQLEVLQDMAAGRRQMDRDALMDVAGALLYVEGSLAAMGEQSDRAGTGSADVGMPDHVDHARDAVLRESLAGLEEAKDGIVEFIASQWDHGHLRPVPERLDSVRGSLEMVFLDRPAVILRQCVRYIREQLLSEDAGTPEWRVMDTLADAITGVEYYLERLSDDPRTTDDVLKIARESVAALGYPLDSSEYEEAGTEPAAGEPAAPAAEDAVQAPAEPPLEARQPEEQQPEEQQKEQQLTEQQETQQEEPSAPEPATPPEERPPEQVDAQEDEEAGLPEEPEVVGDEPDVTSTLVDEQSAETDTAAAEQQPPESSAPEPAPAEASAADAGEDQGDLIDDEIIEIFVEEAGEVLEALNEHFPRWVANQSDEEALVEFRRAFHTLKGSGRMVGASTVGELAWSIENMLNRVIDKTIPPTPELVELVRRVHGLIPSLVDAFARQQEPPVDVTPLEEAAFLLADGGRLEAVPEVEAPQAAAVDLPEPDVPPPVEGGDTAEPQEEGAAPVEDQPDSEADEAVGDYDIEEIEYEAPGTAAEDEGESQPSSDEQPASAADPEAEAVSLFEGKHTEAPASSELDNSFDPEEIDFEMPGEEDATADITEVVSEEASTAGDDTASAEPEVDPVLLDIFRNEGQTNLALVIDWLDSLDENISEHPVDDSVHRALHTLKGSARMAEMWCVAEVAEPAEKLVKELVNQSYPADRETIQLLRDVVATLRPGVDEPDPRVSRLEGADALLERIAQVHGQLGQKGGTGSDQHLISVFLSEGMDLIMDAESLLDRWAEEPEKVDELVRLRDELGTLADSAETAGLQEIHQLAATMRDCYTAVAEHRLHCSDGFLELAHQAHEGLMNMMDNLAAAQTVQPEEELVAALRRLLETGTPPEGPGGGTAAPTPGPQESASGAVSPGPDEPPSGDRAELETPETAPAKPEPPAADAAPVEASELDPELLGIFLEEADEILESAAETLEAWREDRDPATVAALQRELHTLKGGARMAGATPIGDLSHTLEDLYDGCTSGSLEPDEGLFDLLHRCHDRLADMVEALRGGQPCQAAPELVQAVEAFLRGEGSGAPAAAPARESPAGESQAETGPVSQEAEIAPAGTGDETAGAAAVAEEQAPPPPPPERDPELVAIFLEEAEEILESIGQRLDAWMEDPDNLVEVQSLQRDLHTLKGGSRMAEVPELGNLAHELEDLYEGLAQGNLSASPSLFTLLQRCHDVLAEMIEAVRAGQGMYPAEDLIRAIQAYAAQPESFTESDIPPPKPITAAQPAAPEPAPAPPPVEQEADSSEVREADTGDTPAPAKVQLPDDVDTDILDIFLDESEELLELIDESIGAWKETPESTRNLDELKRALHTLKGGARLSGLTELGELSHQFEEFLTDSRDNRVPVDEAFFEQLTAWQDRITDLMEQVRTMAGAAGTTDAEEQPVPQETGTAVEKKAETAPEAPQHTQQRAAKEKAQQAQQPQEMVRVASDLLESLVNLAGETSINRARVEQGLSEFALHVEEMGSTIERLYEQLRRLDVETEAQIMSKYKQDLEAGEIDEDFDPLEMDQYSELHQITKQLSESASDLLDLKGTLLDKTRDTETLLLQQSRINTELQEKLMRTRMVPFARLVPRLRRIVRQVSGELGKRVSFDVVNAESELDRTLMERVVAPLEHMLRNAVDHGIEDPEGRQAAGKPAEGSVTLSLAREGGEVVLTLADDGKGIDSEAVRKKAIERGLIDEQAELSAHEIQQFIFDAGFSTADQVTQVSGRGVGMDVVASEIKQMGGSVSIESEKGKGTKFVVHLPFTLAMNRALMVGVGEDTYAIPLEQIEGIVRVSPYELETFFEDDAPDFVYAGQHYQLDYLGHYVHGTTKPPLESQITPMPVLLIRSTEHEIALLVDTLVGSREVVVKSVGPQLSTVAGISGATILGDGSVVIILDIHSLIRASHVQQQHLAVEERRQLEEARREETGEPETAARAPVIMVTDDSVTVRKVTGRFLERQGYEIVTAKDGMDAVAQLEDWRPDLMLLDIEMPRMDGFEVATHMRHNERLKEVPIIMITSRTGEKHQDRAYDIGVDAYLGKPFQEQELLTTISDLLSRSGVTANQ